MRKFQQLVLLIISVVSLALLIVYRHEYNRLHYVLEVFNFFGHPCNISNEITFNSNYDWGPEPVWQQTEDFYTYSAFWNKNSAQVLTLHNKQNSKAIRSCYLWFEDLYKPKIGKLKIVPNGDDVTNNHKSFLYFCSLTSSDRAPYAVSFSSKSKPIYSLKKILLVVDKSNSNVKEFNTTICVSSNVFTKTDFIEFLSYHKLIGARNFLFYGAISHRLSRIITNLSTRLGINVIFLPWNYPLSEGSLTRKFIEDDCLLRALHVSQNVITLDINEYIVPLKHYTVKDLINYYLLRSSVNDLTLPVQKFCIENTERRIPIVLQNVEAHYDDANLVRKIYINAEYDSKIINTQNVLKEVASIHKYVKCDQKPKRVYHDNTITKYYTDLIRTTLVQLNLHDQI